METRHNFAVLSNILPPLTVQEKLIICINIKYKSLRNISKIINISHTTLRAWMRNPEKYPGAHLKIINELGFNPFEKNNPAIGG